MAARPDFGVETIELDLPALAGAFSHRLQEAGVPVTVERAAAFARALRLVAPVSRRRLYWTARAAIVSDLAQVRAFDYVFGSVFGGGGDRRVLDSESDQAVSATPDESPFDPPRSGDRPGGSMEPSSAARSPSDGADGDPPALDLPVPTLASAEEVLRGKRFDALEPHELVRLYGLMAQLKLAAPRRRTRRHERYRHGQRIDMRRTLRASLRTGGEPVRLRRRRRRVVPRRLVLLCDISGSMEPYARAYLQFLTCALGSGPRAEAFVFATRLTRLTRALGSRHPERAIQNAAAAAPDWSSGTRIGEALKTFNDRHGRRGMARGAVVVILSDGWERDDPALLGREMQRLALLANRIVWVNPRISAEGFAPRAGGLLAALPYCDALVSGHNLESLDEVLEAIRGPRSVAAADPPTAAGAGAGAVEDVEPWASATPVPGSSVAMPSGYGPSRGRTTPGWTLGSN